MPARVSRLIEIRPGEKSAVSLLTTFAFCLGLAQVFLGSAAISLFLGAYPASMLPLGYFGVSIAMPLVGAAHAWLERRFDLPRLLLINLCLMALSLLIWRWLVDLPWNGWLLLLYVWWTVVWSILNLALWGLAGRLFDVRQSKRLNGVVGAGEMLAMVLGGLSVAYLVRPLGAANLLLLSAAAIVLGVLVLGRLLATQGAQLQAVEENVEQSADSSTKAQLKDRYLRLIFINSAIACLVFYVVDNAFFSLATAHFPGEEAMAALVGQIDAACGVLLFVSRLFLTAPLLARFGVRGGLLAIPIVVGAGALAVVVAGHLGASTGLIFALAAAVKIGENVCRDSIFHATLQVLFQPLSPSRRLRAQVTSESVVDPLAAAFAALALLFLATSLGFQPEQLFQVLLGLFVIWGVLGWRLQGFYMSSLQRALARRAASGSNADLLEGASSRILRRALDSDFPSEVAFALEGLQKVDPLEYRLALPRLLGHRLSDVRCLALNRIADEGQVAALEQVRQLAWFDNNPRVRGFALRALAALGTDNAVDEVAQALREPDEAVRAGAAIGLIRYGGIQGILLAGNELLAASTSADAELRRSAAAVVGEIGNAAFYQPLLGLLADPEPKVILAALQAAAILRSPALWPAVLPALDRASLRGYAIEALRGGGGAAATAISSRIAQGGISLAQQSRLVRTLGVIDDKHAREVLLNLINCSNRELREQTLAALVRQREPVTVQNMPVVLAQIDIEQADAVWLLQQACACRAEGELSILPPLREQLAAARRRLLLLLQLSHDREAMARVRDRIDDASPERRAYALELLDNLLRNELKSKLLPLFDSLSEAACLAALRQPTASPLPVQQRRLLIEHVAFEWGCAWLQASTICALERSDPDAALRVQQRLEQSSGLPQQAASWWLEHAKVVYTAAQRSEVDWQFVGSLRVGLLREVEIFAQAGESVLASIAERLSEVAVKRGQIVLEQGESGRSLYVIAAGSIGVHMRNSDSPKLQRIATLHAPDIFGEFSLIDEQSRSAMVKADTLSRLYRLEFEDFYDMLFDQPEITRRLIRQLGERLRSQPGYGIASGVDASSTSIAPSANLLDEDGIDALADPLRCRLLVQSIPLLAQLPEPLLETIVANLKPMRVRAGERIYAEGEIGRTIYIVAAGRVHQHRGEQILIERGPRDLFGEFSILDPQPHLSSARAVEESLLLRLDKELLRELLMLWPELARNLLRDLVLRNRAAMRIPTSTDAAASVWT